MLKVLAHYANTGKETLSPFTDSIMYCSRPIQALPVASWLHKHL